MWPEDVPKAARHKLHCAFSALRSSLVGPAGHGHPPYVRFTEGFYELTPAIGTMVDVDELSRRYRAGQRAGGREAIPHYEAACALATGPFLPDDAYADWAIGRREAVTTVVRSMQQALAAHWLAEGRPDEARGWCHRLLAENRTDETAYRLLMQVELAAGHRAEALRQFSACKRAMREELGIDPMPETVAMYEAIRGGTSP